MHQNIINTVKIKYIKGSQLIRVLWYKKVDIKAVGAEIITEPTACDKENILYLIVVGMDSLKITAAGMVIKGIIPAINKNIVESKIK